jgi:hypothetical protein
MEKIGGTMLFFGIGSIVLSFINMQFILLAWIDMWGPTVGWAIRIVLIVGGGVLWFLGKKQKTA